MCDFFSFVMVNGSPRYLDAKWRRKKKADGDNHSTICAELKLNCDKVNKFEYEQGVLRVDQINNEHDHIRHAETWIKKFIKTKEWKDLCLATVEVDAGQIEYMSPTDIFNNKKVQYEAVRQGGLLISYIVEPSERVQLAAVKQDPEAIQFIKNPTLRVQLYAVNNGDYDVIRHIEKPCEKVQIAAIRKDTKAYYSIERPSKRADKLFEKLNNSY